jgi:hypothetical protein
MRQLRTQNETNIVANLPSDSTWNSDDFWLEISATNAYLRPARSHRENIAVRYTNSEHDWAWVPNELVHGNGSTKEAG